MSWSSHAADAFGYLAISYEEPPARKTCREVAARTAAEVAPGY
jgi:hypothetical protein